MSIFRGIMYFIMDASMNMQILIFVCILFLIEERFRHLCSMIEFSKADKIIEAHRSIRHSTLQHIWWLHCSLANATEIINSVYAIQLLFWISTMSFNLMSRIYSLKVFKLSDYGKIRESMLVTDCAWNLVLITTVCHMTAHQANRVGKLIFSPHSFFSLKRVYLQENVDAAAYFQLRKVHLFTVAGLIRIDLPLLLSIFSAITTYLVILHEDSLHLKKKNSFLIFSVTNYFVVNLSVADLLVTTICMPVAVSQAVSMKWIHGEIMCKLSFYLQGVAVAASVFTITAMSIDRYLAIRSPIAFRRVFNRKSTVFVIIALWVVALIIFAPLLRVTSLQNPGIMILRNISFHGSDFAQNISTDLYFYMCLEDFKSVGIEAPLFGTMCFVLVYAIPGFVVVLSYIMMGRTLCARKPPFDCDGAQGSASSQQSFRLVRERRRIAWILLLLAVLFALCWLPYNVLMLLKDLDIISVRGTENGEAEGWNNAISYCLFLGHANSALNPTVYCFMTRNFRQNVTEILCHSPCGLTRGTTRRRGARGTGVIDDMCAGSASGTIRRSLLRKRKMLPGLPIGGHHAVLTLRRTTTTSCDSFYTRHSPHRRCYMLRSLRGRPDTAVVGHAQSKKSQETGCERSKAAVQPVNTLVITDEKR
ncbi:pyroglutamylated RF-amide peptide receptor-like [Apis florea]|uniref:pyroglutamylated RF-amide peptide receptor-like n=1 Tax=Apis florea TaxID=7463 RepID=UPI0012FEF3D9|nr:pyroglutamylated RF-amide peptide receptor-like [Apis florea]